MRVALVALLLVGCLKTEAVECSFGTCPPKTACDEVNHLCVFPDQLTSCVGKADVETCPIGGNPTAGICKNEVCITPTCGDELVYGDEVCDGSVPDVGTCVDSAYDYGTMSCTEICSESTSTCRRLGWHFRNVPGSGGIQAIWEDGAHLYLGGQLGLWHWDGTAWDGPGAMGQTFWVRGIWAGGGQIFLAGDRSGTGVLAHYDGTTWSEMTFTGKRMWSVHGTAPNDVYAAGDGGTIIHFDGTAWTAETTPGMNDLHGIWTTGTRVVAVGNAGVIWLRSPTGFVQKRMNFGDQLLGIAGTTTNDFFIVGAGPSLTGMLLRYDGADAIGDYSSQVGYYQLRAVSGRSSTEFYAVGESGKIYFFDGSAWTPMDSPTLQPLQAVHAGAAKVYAAYQPQYFLEYEGAIWASSPLGSPLVRRMWGDSLEKEVFAVGSGCNVYHFAKGNTNFENYAQGCVSPCPGFLNTVWGANNTAVYAGGPYGALYLRDAGTWTCLTGSFNNYWIWAIWGTAANDVWVAGGDGTGTTAGLAHFDGAKWQDLTAQVAPHMKTIRGVWGTSATNVYFVGDGGAIVRYDGATFTPMPSGSGTTSDLQAIWGTDASDVFAVGEAGTILHYDGTQWTPMAVPVGLTVPTDGTLSDVIGRKSDDVFAIGGRTLLHYDGQHWAPVTWPRADGGAGVGIVDDQLWVSGDVGISGRLVGRLLP